MAVTNVLGYNTNVKTGEVIAARNAAVDLGQGHIAMVRSFQGNTAHQVTPMSVSYTHLTLPTKA